MPTTRGKPRRRATSSAATATAWSCPSWPAAFTAKRLCSTASRWATHPCCGAGIKFDLDPTGGSHVVYGSVDYTYRLYQVFYDTGAVWDRPQEREQKQSVGVGFKKEGFQLAVAFPMGAPTPCRFFRRNEFLNVVRSGQLEPQVPYQTSSPWWLFDDVPFRHGGGDDHGESDSGASQPPPGILGSAHRLFCRQRPGAPAQRRWKSLSLSKRRFWSGNKNHVFTSAVDKFVVSFDLWDRRESYTVVKTVAPHKARSI